MIFYMKATEPHCALLVFSKYDLHVEFVLCEGGLKISHAVKPILTETGAANGAIINHNS